MTEESLFIEALEIAGPVERAAFLDRACGGDPALRVRLDKLLVRHTQGGNFLGRPADLLQLSDTQEYAAGRPADDPLTPPDGGLIGPYKLVEVVGEGGMGTVWLAQQQEPVKRLVAVKVVKAGMDSKSVLARFEAERQALALMDHPNIARVLDAGSTPDGRPYFVMELVKGVSITKFCDERRLTPRERLELFVPVCQAVQHAHQKGVIHRDLKPSNVLVALYDGRPVPKVIDFGVAKAAGQPLTEKTLVTGLGAVVGTPEYMSPEQAEFNQLDIDTRSDVYSLGVLLYELLTGTTPLQRQRVKGTALLELLRLVREEEPPRPSARLSTTDELPSIAARRGVEPRKLSGLVRGELDWIVMRALEKDRGRRYETANGFGMDVQRFLAGEPVQAVPPSARYRLHKLVRRHRRAVVMGSVAAAVVGLAVVGLVVGTVLFQQEQTRAATERARMEAEARRRLETELYRQHIALAEREWSANNLSQMQAMLELCPAEQRGWEWRYLKGLRTNSRSPLSHASEAFSVAFSCDGKLLATGTKAGVVRLWQARGHVLREWQAHENAAYTLSFSPDGRYLASGGWDGTIKLWDVQRIQRDELQKPSLQLDPTRRVWSVAFSPDGKYLAFGSGITTDQKGAFTVWDLGSRREVFTRSHFTDTVTCVAFSPDGRRLATTCQGLVQLWDAQTGQEEQLFLRGPDTRRTGVAFSPDGRYLASVGGNLSVHPDEEVQVWDARTGDLIRSLPGHVGGLRCVAFSPDGRRLASAGLDQTIKIWDAQTGDEVLTLRGHIDLISCLAFSADGHQLASASVDSTVRIWDASPDPESEQGSEFRTLLGHAGGVTDVAFHPKHEHTLVSAGTDGTVRTWDIRGGESLGTLTLPPSNERVRAAYSPDGHRLAAISRGGAHDLLAVWEVDSRKQIGEYRARVGQFLCLAFSPDGRHVATAGYEYFMRVREAATGVDVRSPFKVHEWPVLSVAFSPDGRHIATGSGDRTVRVWDWKAQRELSVVSLQHAGRVTGVAYSRDGKRLASASLDRTVKVWDTSTWKLLNDLPQSSSVQCVALDRDGPRLAWGGNDGTVAVWDGPGTAPVVLRGHTSWVQAVAFSPNGKWIASASLDGTVKVWNAPPEPKASVQKVGPLGK
jgi:WD40 repeat protein/serine/threonine protein kinase